MSQLSAGVRYAQILSKRFTDLCPGKLQRCASCNELKKKKLFGLRMPETDAFFFFFLFISLALPLAVKQYNNSIEMHNTDF